MWSVDCSCMQSLCCISKCLQWWVEEEKFNQSSIIISVYLCYYVLSQNIRKLEFCCVFKLWSLLVWCVWGGKRVGGRRVMVEVCACVWRGWLCWGGPTCALSWERWSAVSLLRVCSTQTVEHIPTHSSISVALVQLYCATWYMLSLIHRLHVGAWEQDQVECS